MLSWYKPGFLGTSSKSINKNRKKKEKKKKLAHRRLSFAESSYRLLVFQGHLDLPRLLVLLLNFSLNFMCLVIILIVLQRSTLLPFRVKPT